jgi:hypothetical protein
MSISGSFLSVPPASKLGFLAHFPYHYRHSCRTCVSAGAPSPSTSATSSLVHYIWPPFLFNPLFTLTVDSNLILLSPQQPAAQLKPVASETLILTSPVLDLTFTA